MSDTRTVDVTEAGRHLVELLAEVRAGTEIVLTSDDEPMARLVPMPQPPQARKPGIHEGAIWVSDDFDDALPDGLWLGKE